MNNMNPDKIYLSLTNLNNTDFPPSVPGTLHKWIHQYLYLLLY